MIFETHIQYDDIRNLVSLNPVANITFRYFDKRTKDCFKNHVYHFILKDESSIGYGHLDYEDEKLWLGMCVFDSFVGKGYGRLILKKLIENRNGRELYLSVDKENFKAINLYLSEGFRIYSQTEKIYLCNLK